MKKKVRRKARAKKAARKKRASPRSYAPARERSDRTYVLQIYLDSGPITKAFARKNKIVSRTIEIRGDQTLEEFHYAIFDAFDRWEQHLYEFQLGKRPFDPDGLRYTLPDAARYGGDPDGDVKTTTLDSLGLKVGRVFGYWFDFGDDWYHQIVVDAVNEADAEIEYPRVTARTGASPPQYAGG